MTQINKSDKTQFVNLGFDSSAAKYVTKFSSSSFSKTSLSMVTSVVLEQREHFSFIE